MDSVADLRNRLIPLVVIGGLVFGSAFYLDELGVASLVSMSFIVEVSLLFGIDASIRDGELIVGGLVLPWTPDCSGINALVMLLATALWAGREEPMARLILRLGACFPLAVLVNAVRVLLIASYRHVMYPEWESPQLHYFIGFICLLPCVALIVPSFRSRSSVFWLELLFFAMALSLAIPAAVDPGGTLVLVSTLLVLVTVRFRELNFASLAWTSAWLGLGCLLGASAMEGFWLPWLLMCPLFFGDRLVLAPERFLVIAGTAPVIAMIDYAQPLVLLAAVVLFFRLARAGSGQAPEALISPRFAVLVAMLVLSPLILPIALDRGREIISPPAAVAASNVTFNTWQLRVPTQSHEVRAFWFGPFGDGRHHSLVSCMKFRGIDLAVVASNPGVYEGDGRWMVEYFIHDGQLVDSYADYLFRSLLPYSSSGVHLILEAPVQAVGVDFFAMESQRVAQRVARLHAQQAHQSQSGELL